MTIVYIMADNLNDNPYYKYTSFCLFLNKYHSTESKTLQYKAGIFK